MGKYIYKKAENYDTDKLKQVYKICFNDEDEYMDFFYDKTFNLTETFAALDEEKVISMATTFFVELNAYDKKYKGIYLYAVSTLPSHRGKGLMRKVEEYIKNYYKNQDYDFICLVPTNESLIGMYGKLGYDVVLKLGFKTIKKSDICDDSVYSEISVMTKDEFITERKRYLSTLNSYIEFDETLYDYIYDELIFDEFDIIQIKNEFATGYIICKKYDKKLYIKEMTVSKESFNLAINEIFTRYDVDTVDIRVGKDYSQDLDIKPYAMFKALNKELLLLTDAYINLMLD